MASAVRSPRRSPGRVPIAAPLGAAAAASAFGLILSTQTPFAGAQLVLVGLFLLVPAWLATTRHTTWALGGLLLYMGLIDGFIKLMSNSELPTIGRDILLYALLFGLAVRALKRGDRFVLPAFGGWALAWTALVIVQLANPDNQSWAHSFASLRQHVEFVPLLFVGYLEVRSQRRLKGFLALLLAAAAVNGAVGAYQSGLTPEQLASWGPGYSDLIKGVGVSARTAEGEDGKSRVRPMGLGSDMGFAGFLGITAIPGAIALLLLTRRRPLQTGLIVVGLLGAIVGALTSQSRTVAVSTLIAVLAFVVLTAVAGQARRSVMAIALVSAAAGLAIWAIGAVDSGTFYRYKSVGPGQVASTTLQSRKGTWQLIPEYAKEIPFGAGIGSAGPAAGFLSNKPPEYNAESLFTFLIVEVGIPGLVLFLAFQAAVYSTILRGLRRVREPSAAILLAAVASPLMVYAVSWSVGTPTTSSPNAPYIWFAVGVIGYWLVERPRQTAAPHAAT